MNTAAWLSVLFTSSYVLIAGWLFFKMTNKNIENLSSILDNPKIKWCFLGKKVEGYYKNKQILWVFKFGGERLLFHELYLTSEVGKNQYAYFQESAITQNTKWNYNKIYYVFKWPPSRFQQLWGRVYESFESKEILEELVQAAEIVESKIKSGSVPVPKVSG